jgi:hypothetical protein
MGQMNDSHHRCFVQVSLWVWHLEKDVRHSKCEATGLENCTDIKLQCVTGNIDTQALTRRQQSVSDNNYAFLLALHPDWSSSLHYCRCFLL